MVGQYSVLLTTFNTIDPSLLMYSHNESCIFACFSGYIDKRKNKQTFAFTNRICKQVNITHEY